MCHGLITTLHYCYYPTAEAGSKSVVVEVWRQNQSTATYSRVANSLRKFLITTETSPAAVVCITRALGDAYISVNANDVIGVRLPGSNSLPIVASGAPGYRLGVVTNLMADSASIQVQVLPNHALHLQADISKFHQN